MTDDKSVNVVSFKTLTFISILAGFLLIPFHEFGHVLGFWLTGHRAGMSYARAYLIPDGPEPFLGVLGGSSLPIILAAFSVLMIYRRWNLSVFYPLAILGSFERLAHYLAGWLPSDEYNLARMMGWGTHTFKYIFLSIEILLLLLVAVSFFRNRIKFKQAALIVLIPVVCFCVLSGFGLFVIERFIFSEQFKIQFGHIRL
jgi:hypothetical protein